MTVYLVSGVQRSQALLRKLHETAVICEQRWRLDRAVLNVQLTPLTNGCKVWGIKHASEVTRAATLNAGR